MGRMAAEGMVEYGGSEIALRWHMTANHYPPCSENDIELAKRALALVPDYDAEMQGVTHQDGRPVTVAEVIETFHLHPFIEEAE